MNKKTFSKLTVLLFVFAFMGCAGGSKPSLSPILSEMNIKPNRFNKKVAVVMINSSCSVFGTKAEELFRRSLVETIRAETRHLHLVAPEDPGSKDAGFSAFMSFFQPGSAAIDQPAMVALARSQGYQGVLTFRFPYVELRETRSGILWFRKNRYSIEYGVVLNMYDPSTGAKIISRIIEKKTGIEREEYESLKSGSVESIGAFDETITDLAEDLGGQVADVLNNSIWRTSVVAVQADRVFLPARKISGVEAGDRLAVFKIQKIQESQSGSQFLLPEQKVAELRVVSVGDELTEAVGDATGLIQEGDLVVPLNE